MRYTEENLIDGKSRVVLEFSLLDFMEIKLHDFDKKLLDECNKSNKISDKLLALEMLARRIEKGGRMKKAIIVRRVSHD